MTRGHLSGIVNNMGKEVKMNKLSPRQKKILKIFKRYIEEEGYPPTARELRNELGVSSMGTICHHLNKLREKGYLENKEGKARGTRLSSFALKQKGMQYIPLVGRVPAGQPIEAIEGIEELIQLDKKIGLPEGVFALRVEGNSMIEADIKNGDIAFVKPQPTAENGEIVVAMVENEGTIKKFYKRKDRIELKPANPEVESIFCKNVRIIGKVVGVIHLFRK